MLITSMVFNAVAVLTCGAAMSYYFTKPNCGPLRFKLNVVGWTALAIANSLLVIWLTNNVL